ncbi:hypothetical protein [Tunturiibacter gelidiferens]|uniref:hypothetical protein n=1 Tax=Tunturiibacter gelidiferens TaxID=3069689 RepID=UPI003D9B3B51
MGVHSYDVGPVVFGFVAQDPKCAAIAGYLVRTSRLFIELSRPDMLTGIERDCISWIVVRAEDYVIDVKIAGTCSSRIVVGVAVDQDQGS